MLRFFKRKKNDPNKPPEPEMLKELHWPFRMVLKLRLNPFIGKVFFHSIICMAAKMAAVDGAVTEAELKLFMQLLEREFALSKKQVDRARKILFEANRSKKTFTDFAVEFQRNFKEETALLENAMDVLLAMAYVDNKLSIEEQKLLAEAGGIFQLDPSVLERLTKRHHRPTTIIEKASKPDGDERKKREKAYERQQEEERRREEQKTRSQKPNQNVDEIKVTWYHVLGVSPDSSAVAVKSAYRKLVRKYHPDKLPANIPEEMKRASTEQFIAIQLAYEFYLRTLPKR